MNTLRAHADFFLLPINDVDVFCNARLIIGEILPAEVGPFANVTRGAFVGVFVFVVVPTYVCVVVGVSSSVCLISSRVFVGTWSTIGVGVFSSISVCASVCE